MTLEEAKTAIRAILAEREAQPARFLSRVILVVRKSGRPPGGERMRILPGVLARVVCVNSDGGIVVDVEVEKLEKWLERA